LKIFRKSKIEAENDDIEKHKAILSHHNKVYRISRRFYQQEKKKVQQRQTNSGGGWSRHIPEFAPNGTAMLVVW
jgi:hypothetical protein